MLALFPLLQPFGILALLALLSTAGSRAAPIDGDTRLAAPRPPADGPPVCLADPRPPSRSTAEPRPRSGGDLPA